MNELRQRPSRPPVWDSTPWSVDATPSEVEGFARPTANRRLGRYLRYLANTYPDVVRLQRIGVSGAGRAVFAVHCGASRPRDLSRHETDGGRLRVLLFAQQHGNEPGGKEACLLLLRRLVAEPRRDLLEHLDVCVVPQLNPDGAAAGRRQTANGSDLNRAHHTVAEPEHQALYGLFHRFRPHVTLDLHEHNAERHYRAAGVLPLADLLSEGPTNLNVAPALRALAAAVLAAAVPRAAAAGYLQTRYMRGDPADARRRPRYSSLGAYDGRNLPALFGTLAFIYEVTRHNSLDGGLQRRAGAGAAGLETLLDAVTARRDEIARAVAEERARRRTGPPGPVVLRARYRLALQSPPICWPYLHRDSGTRGEFLLSEARTQAEATRQRPLPHAYWLDLPAEHSWWDDLRPALAGHGIALTHLETPLTGGVERYRFQDVTRRRLDGPPRVTLRAQEASETIPVGAVLLPCAQSGGVLAALLLEPDAMDSFVSAGRWGAAPGGDYPIKRIVTPLPPGALPSD